MRSHLLYERFAAGAVVIWAMAQCACGADDTTPSLSPVSIPDASVFAGESTVVLEGASQRLTLVRGGQDLLRFPLDAWHLGLVDELEDAKSYDPYPMAAQDPTYSPPETFRWVRAEGLVVDEATDGRLLLTLQFPEGKSARLEVEAQRPDSFRVLLQPNEDGAPVAMMRFSPRVDGSEGFYGLGEYFDQVNHRGKVRAMQLEAGGGLESGYNEAHVPIPFVIGTRGWGLFVENPYPAAFDVATQQEDLLDVLFGTGPGSAEGLVLHLFAAERPLDLTRHYYDVTGYPALPARWALGPWIWRDENRDQAQVQNDLEMIRDLDLATTAYWIDRPYATGVNTFDFNESQFPTPQQMIDRMHQLGFRTALWHTPYLDEKDDSTAALRQEAAEKGYYPPQTGILLNSWGRPIDLTNPQAFAWWQSNIRHYREMGIEGFKLDYGEDIVVGIFGARTGWKFHDGSDERTMHSRFQLFYHRAYAETLPETGGFLICRGGTYGDQVNVSVIWPGDLDANFAAHGERVVQESGSYTAVGGLPASLVAALSLGPSGFPFYGSDTGGYRHCPPDKETFTRWFQQTALSTVMQIGTSCNDVAWEWNEENGFDQEMLDNYRAYTRLHLRLFPYQWTYAMRLAQDGRPIQRALGLAYPELGEHPSDTYLFGDSLLVAPVVERGARKRQVLMPAGTWVDWWTGEEFEGGQTLTVDAALDKLPLFLQAGGIVPMLRPTIDTMSPVQDPQRVDSYATSPGIVYARIAAGPASSFTLFDGMQLSQRIDAAGMRLSSADGAEFREGVVFEVVAARATPETVTDNGVLLPKFASLAMLEAAVAGWTYLADQRMLVIKVGAGAHEVLVPGT